jgi:putative membrane protein
MASAALHAQAPQSPPSASPNAMLSSDDRTFVQKAAEGGMKEVEHGRLVASKASSADVKAYANRLVKDHSAANTELKNIAKGKNITLPSEKQAIAGHDEPWMSQSGKDFDKAFIAAAIKDHQEDIQLFEKEAASGSDAQLKAFANKQLPTLRAHLKQAQDLQGKLGTQ